MENVENPVFFGQANVGVCNNIILINSPTLVFQLNQVNYFQFTNVYGTISGTTYAGFELRSNSSNNYIEGILIRTTGSSRIVEFVNSEDNTIKLKTNITQYFPVGNNTLLLDFYSAREATRYYEIYGNKANVNGSPNNFIIESERNLSYAFNSQTNVYSFLFGSPDNNITLTFDLTNMRLNFNFNGTSPASGYIDATGWHNT